MRTVPPNRLLDAVRAIEHGELVVVPTRRWYMICADAANTSACQRIFESKQRPRSKSLVLVTPSPEYCEEHFILHPQAQRLIEAFWPGDLALLLPWRASAEAARYTAVGSPALVTSAPELLGELASLTRTPLAATTANVSGDAAIDVPGPAITVAEVRAFLDLSGVPVSVVIDGGVCPASNHLTIVDCEHPEARLVRAGLVHERAVAAALARDVRNA